MRQDVILPHATHLLFFVRSQEQGQNFLHLLSCYYQRSHTITMTYINNKVRSMKHPMRSGLFAVLAVLVAGMALGMATGFGSPTGAFAQVIPDIIVTAPAPVVPVLPPVPIVIAPIVVPVPVVTVPAPVTPGNNGGNPGSDDGNKDVVVTAPKQDNPNTSPCCTTPSVPGTDIIVTAPTQDNPNTSPCCGIPTVEVPIVPIIPLTPIVPIVPPIIPPPSGPEAGCIALTASTNGPISPGAAVTLTWETLNTNSITIDNGVGTFNTASSSTGHVVVNPTTTTTYTGTVSNGTQSIHCKASVTVVPTTTGGSSCIALTADRATVTATDNAVVLKWTVDAPSVTIDGVGTFTTATGTVTVNPTVDTIYSAHVPGEAIKIACQAPVTITTGGGGCTTNCGGGGCTTNCGGGGCSGNCGGGGGGNPTPRVFFSTRQAPPLASVYLSQIPYTGLDLGPVGTIVYWLMLIIWSLAAAYLVLFGGLPVLRRKLAVFGGSVRDTLHSETESTPSYASYAHAPTSSHEAIHEAAVAYAMPQASKPAVSHAAPASHGVQYATVAPSRAEMTGQGFKAFAQGSALTIDDIVKGLSRESGMDISTETSVPTHAPEIHHEVIAEAPIAYAAPEPVYAAPIIPPAPRAQAQAPRQEVSAAPVHTEVPGFITAILNGERDVVFGIIRSMNQAGHDVEDFMAQAICALDDAYRARIDGTPVHSDVKLVTDHLATPFLERLVTSLTTAVDGSYSMGVTGIKLALTRALAVAQG
ncbi:MAG: outer membrane protein [Parcubacteria group bacterium]|nr:outer membrane protein [Parcubacteria group bacterium]